MLASWDPKAIGTDERTGMGTATEKEKTAGRMRPREWLFLAGVIALALALRLVYLSEIRDHALFSVLTADPAVYHAQAMDVLGGKLAPAHAYFHSSPLYPLFLAAVIRLAGPGLHAVRLVQACVGCLSVCLIYVLSRLTVGPRPALAASALAALYVPFIFFEGEHLEITLVIAFLAGALILLQGAGTRAHEEARPPVWRAAAAGALLGLAALGKPNLLLFAPVGAAWLIHRSGALQRVGPRASRTGRRSHGARGAGRRGAKRLPPDRTLARERLGAALFLVAAGIVILPATVHNYRAEGDLIPVSSNGGINLFIGNHPGAPGTFTVPADMRLDLRVASRAAAERATGRELSAGEVSDYWAGMAFAFMRERPAMWLEQTARKFALFWNHYEIPNHYDLRFVAGFAPLLRLPLGTFAVVAPLGIAGLCLALFRRRNVGLLAVFGVTFMCSVVPFFITGRYRLAIALVLLPGAGFAVSEFVDFVRGRRWRPLAGLAAAVAALALLVNVDILEFNSAQMHNTLGAILARSGDLESAAVEFAAALEDNPSDLSARRNLGLAYLQLGRHTEAARELELAVRAHPGYFEAWLELGRAYAGQDSLRRARETWTRALRLNPPPQIASELGRLISQHTEEEDR